MLNKNDLIKEFSKEPETYYTTQIFKSEGFERKKCIGCGKYFWTLDEQRKFCGDPEHEPYTFFKAKPVDVDYIEQWNKFADFFRKNGHEIIEKYPVVSRWRPDLYFTIAGIQDFQRLENGKMSFEYPANPLVVPQICMRFNDITNVGVTGRHGTAFMMANQTAFNYPKEGYWRDRTIELNFKYLTEVLGVKKRDLTYVEDVWAMGDFSEYGPSLEFFSNGLELGNNVFTQFEYFNERIKELDGMVVDVGWGFERLLWFLSGKQTNYDVIYQKELEFIHKELAIKPDTKLYSKLAGMLGAIDMTQVAHGSEEEKKIISRAGISDKEYYEIIKPMQAAYAIADHSRTILFAVSDGALPSNVGGGYNLRILLRRMFDFIQRYHQQTAGADFIMKIIEMEARHFKPLYNNIDENLDTIRDVINVEERRYNIARTEASKIAHKIVEGGEKLTTEKLRTLYESNGISPEFLNNTARSMGKPLDIPEEAFLKIMKGDFADDHEHEKEREVKVNIDGLPKTDQLFYKFVGDTRSKVLKCSGNEVVLDATPFYAEGGGQEADVGTINGHKVNDVKMINGVIVHLMEGKPPFKTGEEVHSEVDLKRRLRLMAHHTATHLVNASARKVLGKHAWQEGASKTANKATLDIAHFEKLTPEQVREIESTANGFILNGIKVSLEELDRNKAESMYGFGIYQGHGVPASKLRIIVIRDLKGNLIDAQACGGLHLIGRETSIGLIKIISASRPHDGIDRLEYVAGPAAYDYINSMENEIREIAKISGQDKDKIQQGLKVQMEEHQKYRKSAKAMGEMLAGYIAADLEKESAQHIIKELDFDRKELRDIATKITEKQPTKIVLLYNKDFDVTCIAGEKAETGAIDFLKANVAKIKKGKFTGGGSKKIAEGKIA